MNLNTSYTEKDSSWQSLLTHILEAKNATLNLEGDKCLISIIIPAYNLSNKIKHTVKNVKHVLNSLRISYEIVIVDDGSSDNTYQKALEITDNNIKVLRYENNQGKGYALLHGLKYSTGNLIMFFDGDLDIPAEQIPLLIKAFKNKNVDAAVTVKWHPHSKVKAHFIRKFLSKVFNVLVRFLTGIELSDTQTGAKIFKKKVLDDVLPLLTVKRYAFDVELLTAITTRGYKIVEVPAAQPIKLTSKFELHEIIKMLIDLLAITYRHRVKRQYAEN